MNIYFLKYSMELPMLPLELPLEASPILPNDILKEIALKSPAAYLLLVQTTKKIHFDQDAIMKHFTTARLGDDYSIPPLVYCLPNGNRHIIDDVTPSMVDDEGTLLWYYRGQRHRGNDQPAIIYSDGTQEWYHHGQRHRDNDQPATIYFDGYKEWYQYGQIHRDNDRPAVIYPDGTQGWWCRDERHRNNDLPAFIDPTTGVQKWFRRDVEYTPEI
jgi:hypothetical protein